MEQADRQNPRPCGDRTIAVINDARNNQYVFCALGDGRVGVLENTWDPDAERPLSDRIADPVELLRTVAADVPQGIIDAVSKGVASPEVFVKGPPRTDVPHLLPVSACNLATFRADYCGSEPGSYWDNFASNYAYNTTYPANPYLACTHNVRVLRQRRMASVHRQRFTGLPGERQRPLWSGACAAKERVLSCGGSTVFNTWRRETVDSGSWVTSLDNYWIAENTAAVWTIHANSAGSCAAGADRDDMRYRADSEPGAYNNYSLIFIKWVDDTVACSPTQ